ncbi:isoaspartyl peptidase/L-asparaginase family protein [Lentisalinibacter salinarum]|uniref:isoaspartyl peptidase/L-asparaginase family protein n=1 Tax=Lentisalinibacter salinarum TaxID=2992239 RepID=UPI003868D241
MNRTATQAGRTAIAVHGGAGLVRRADLPPERETRYHEALREALAAGHELLAAGGSAMDAVTAAVVVLEDNPLFNAGRGAVFNHEGGHELDASVMDGSNLAAGGVAGVRRVRNPVLAARAVLEQTPYVLLAGAGAEDFAREQGLALVEPDWFSTPQRRAEWERARAAAGDDSAARPEEFSLGTVGAVALDRGGNLAAATSTGGLTNKRWGRVGDTPVIGAGTWAENGVCAVSTTGDGEYFLRTAAAHDVAAMIRYGGAGLGAAARRVVGEKLRALGGNGGLIAVDGAGMPVFEQNCAGMYRGGIDWQGRVTTAVFAGNP